jgi:hypothetical protein
VVSTHARPLSVEADYRSGMGLTWRRPVSIALVACTASAAFGCQGGDDRLSVKEFVAKADAVCVSERRASRRQAINANAYLRSRNRIRAGYGKLQPPPERFAAALREFLRAFDDFTRAQLLIEKNPRAVATLREVTFGTSTLTDDVSEMGRRLERDFRHAERVLNRDERLASLFVTQNLADARVEVARLRLPLQCGEKLTRSTREARVHNSVAPMCLLYHPDIFAKALGVEASTKKIAHALRELTGLPRVEPACLEGFAFQRGNG